MDFNALDYGMGRYSCGEGLISFAPSLIFGVGYLLLFQRTFSQWPFAFRGRGVTTIFKWSLGAALFHHLSTLWVEVIDVVKVLADKYSKKASVSHSQLKRYLSDPQTDAFIILFILSLIPYALLYYIKKNNEDFRFTWMEVRRRYRSELGSARYYLGRPCVSLEGESARADGATSVASADSIAPIRVRSENDVRRKTKKKREPSRRRSVST